MEKVVYLFPGQGAQYVGMGKDLYEAFTPAREVFERANTLLGYDLARICFFGPEEKLNSTALSQVAIFVTSVAVLEVFEKEVVREEECFAAAGLSLGEYTALYYGGAFNFEDVLQVVKKRGQYMQEASEEKPGGMVCIIGLDDEEVEEIAQQASQAGEIIVANLNCPGQRVLSGTREAVALAARLAEERQALKVVHLKVSGAFHSRFMATASEKLAQDLARVEIKPLRVPIVSNVTGSFVEEPEEILSYLIKQVTSPVLWQSSMEFLASQGAKKFYEIGPGRVLSGLLKRTLPEAVVQNIADLKTLERLRRRFSAQVT